MNHLLLAHVKGSLKHLWDLAAVQAFFLNDDRISCTWRRRANSIILLPIERRSIPSLLFLTLSELILSPNSSTDHLQLIATTESLLHAAGLHLCLFLLPRTTPHQQIDHLCSSTMRQSWFRKTRRSCALDVLSADGIHSQEVVLHEFGDQKEHHHPAIFL